MPPADTAPPSQPLSIWARKMALFSDEGFSRSWHLEAVVGWAGGGAELRGETGWRLLPCCPPFPRWLSVKTPASSAGWPWASWCDEPSHCGCPSSSSYVDGVFGIHVHKAEKQNSKKTGSPRASLVVEQRGAFLRHWVRKPRRPRGGREACVPSSPLFKCWASPEGCVFFLEGKACAFDSRTEVEKLSLTYFLSSASLALSSQALWKSLNWETDSCNQTLAWRETSWILMGVLLLHEVGRAESV